MRGNLLSSSKERANPTEPACYPRPKESQSRLTPFIRINIIRRFKPGVCQVVYIVPGGADKW